MRTMRLSLAGTIILMLLGSASVVVAQESEDAGAITSPVVVTGTLECLGETPADQAPDASAVPADAVVNVHEWQATDPRLSGEVEYSGRWAVYPEASEATGVPEAQQQAVYEIVNEGGKWLCEASRLPDPRVPGEQHELVFHGQGEYEVLTAWVHIDWSQEPFNFTGLILPGDAPPYAVPQG